MDDRRDQTPVAPHAHREVRASDEERQDAVQRLVVACGQGRLSLDELRDRSQGAYGSHSSRELTELLADLPGPVGTADLRRLDRLARELLTEAADSGVSRGELATLLTRRW